MAKVNETIGIQTQTNLLRNMFENIAQELAPQYEGNVVVLRYEPYNDSYIQGGNPLLYVAEENLEKDF